MCEFSQYIANCKVTQDVSMYHTVVEEGSQFRGLISWEEIFYGKKLNSIEDS